MRNAFGAYGTVMREVTASPLMGEYLTYAANGAPTNGKTFANENYARELMQLFSIGHWELNVDGTPVLDQAKQRVETYTSDDIMAFSRVWTGLKNRAMRPNIAREVSLFGSINANG